MKGKAANAERAEGWEKIRKNKNGSTVREGE
jgi:hypothetical protein